MIFLQRIVAKTNVIRGCLFWIKEVVLRILYAKWCKQNSNEIGVTLWQCLTTGMTLFDVVYLDIVHGFDVPNDVLLEYVDIVDKGWSADLVCRLGRCYYNEFYQGVNENQVKFSILYKSFLIMQHAFDWDCPAITAILTCILTISFHIATFDKFPCFFLPSKDRRPQRVKLSKITWRSLTFRFWSATL